jgi:hypothetical protein|tara:strand:- start:102 stop:263 length:162 start_codon:yes stop_codon:yes gene_type:complete
MKNGYGQGEAVIQLHDIARFVVNNGFDKTIAADIRSVADKLNLAEPVSTEENK